MSTATLEDPRQAHETPPQPAQKLDPPGLSADMEQQPDHGEQSYRGTGKLQGRRALITGGDSGIGRAIAIAFAREGADVAISYLSEEEDARETERWVREAGRKAALFSGDLADARHRQELAQEATSALGGIDILVNNAAHQRTYEDLAEVPLEDFERTFAVNVTATFHLSQLLLPQIAAGGSIINTASIQSFDPSNSLIAYAATKSAIASLTRSLAVFAMKRGVRVNAVAPGPIWTPLIPATMPKEQVKQFGSNTTFGRPGQPAEMAPIFVFLASGEASYVTGEIYGATGGQMPI